MSDGLTGEQRLALIRAYGTVDNAKEEARRRSPALQQLWETWVTTPWDWHGHMDEFWALYWKDGLPVLGIGDAPHAKLPRHRPPDPISDETVKQLMWELAQRKAKPRDREFTQEKIGDRLGVDRSRVQQAERLQRVGWNLLRSDPEFSANDGFVRWPNPEKAAQVLASEHAEN